MELYLIHPENEAYVEGRADKPASIELPGQIDFIAAGVLVLFLVLVFIPASSWLQVQVSNVRASYLLNEGTVATQGRIINRYTSEDSEGDTLYHVVFEYVVDDKRLTHEQVVSEEAYARYEQGVTLDIEYARSDPSVARLAGTVNVSPLFALVGLVIALASSLIFVLPLAYATVTLIAQGLKHRAFLLKRRAFLREFLREGQKLEGELLSLDVEEAVDSEGDKYTVTIVRVAFRAPDGHVVRGERRYGTSRGQEQPPPAEAAVAIFYKDDQAWEVL